jgi:hypothetical protein
VYLKKVLKDRPFITFSEITPYWLLAFIEGDGSFQVGLSKKRKLRSGLPVINCKLNIMQKEYLILKRIQLFLGVGNVVSKSSGQFSYDVAKRSDIDHIISILDKYEFVSPHKLHDYIT